MNGTKIFLISIAVTALLPARMAFPCGPDFQPRLLEARAKVMNDLQEGVFVDEVRQLVAKPPHAFRYVHGEPKGARTRGGKEEKALYEKGAQAYKQRNLEAAKRHFLALLALPADKRKHRSTWAALMLGKLTGDVRYFRQVRALAKEGFTDELGLAVFSYGEEAGALHMRGLVVDVTFPEAITLYARQAAYGDPSGASSLLYFTRRFLEGNGEEFFRDEVTRALLSVYLYTRAYELPSARAETLMQRLVDAGEKNRWLAATAYRQGKWELAEKLASGESRLSKWVRAKLALRSSDYDGGQNLLQETARLCRGKTASRVHGELMVMALWQGKGTEAMQHAWAMRDDYADALFIADRVLTLDELAAFVDELPPSPKDDENEWYREASIDAMRDLYARRLSRHGYVAAMRGLERVAAAHFVRALSYYTKPEDRIRAATFGERFIKVAQATTRLDRAKALFEASISLRKDGMEVIGMAESPDWTIYNGGYAPDMRPLPYQSRASSWGSMDAWASDWERQRVIDSRPQTLERYHYRRLASEAAETAAMLMPTKSHAYAALLCHAAQYVSRTNHERMQHLYRLYIDTGPSAVDMNFGAACPAPDFAGARKYLPKTAEPANMTAIVLSSLLVVLPIGFFLVQMLRANRDQASRARLGTIGSKN